MLPYNKKLKNNARRLRNDMTDAERLLWSKIRKKQLKDVQFYRQKTIGNCIADFYCPRAKLVIELDGGQHYCADGIKKDAVRDRYLTLQGLNVLRFSNIDVMQNIEGVLDNIMSHI
jgi:very-short-patch-repair endonuclease